MKKILAFIIAFFFLVFPFKAKAISTSAKAAILINGDTGEVIYSQNANERLPMASTTKIMTALLLCEHGELDREITVSAEMLKVEGSSMGLLAGDRVTLRGLLYGMMLPSGNDAANVTAYTLGKTVDGFVKMMNDKALQLGLKNTHFETPSGLDGDEHYTSAADLATLARVAMQNKDFYEAASSPSVVLEYGNPPYRRSLSNHNRLLKTFEGAVGVKTGFTKKSGRCLVSAAKRDGKYVIAVSLSSPDDWADHKALLEYGFNKTKVLEMVPNRKSFSIPVINSNEFFEAYIEPLRVGVSGEEKITAEIFLPKFLYAPIKKGEQIGKVIYKMNGNALLEAPIISNRNINRANPKSSFLNSVLKNAGYIFLNLWEK